MKPIRIIISGGGTGGHIFPALSIARAIQRRENDAEILFVGAHDKMEMEKVPAAGYKIVGLPVAGFHRKSISRNIAFIPKLLISLAKCRSIIKAFKPDIVVGVGGFASGPLLWTAQRMKIPTLIQEQNSYAGVTNKLLAAKAKKICVAYSGMEKYFPADKIVLTGNPVRRDLLNSNSIEAEAIEHFKLRPEKKTLLVVGGSLGARTINEAIAANLDELIHKDIQVIWQTGKYYFDTAQTELQAFNKHNVQAHKFINRMDLAFAAADIIISRAGAGTISELCIVGKPVILVPSPNVAEDHQSKNALSLATVDAALLVKDKEAKDNLIPTLMRLIANDNQIVQLGIKIKELAKPDADDRIVDEIFNIIK